MKYVQLKLSIESGRCVRALCMRRSRECWCVCFSVWCCYLHCTIIIIICTFSLINLFSLLAHRNRDATQRTAETAETEAKPNAQSAFQHRKDLEKICSAVHFQSPMNHLSFYCMCWFCIDSFRKRISRKLQIVHFTWVGRVIDDWLSADAYNESLNQTKIFY